jgi:hypothetical protein
LRVKIKILTDLAFFLNSVTPDMALAEWEKFHKAAQKRKAFSHVFTVPAFTERVTLAEAQALRAEVARDLAYRDKNPKAPFASLLGSLNRLELKTVYQCLPLSVYGKPLPGQVILKAGGDSFVPRVYPKATTPKELLYVTLGAALMAGVLGRLKTCLHCNKWIVGKNTGKRFCSLACKDAFHYAARIKSGYFKDYQQERRAHGL